jgi:hypothetical protein
MGSFVLRAAISMRGGAGIRFGNAKDVVAVSL